MERYSFESEMPKQMGISSSIKWHETDINRQMRPTAFLNIAQELANVHAERPGFGYDDLITSKQVWVLSRMKVRFNRLPEWRERYFAATWHKGMQGLFGLRDFALFNGDKERTVDNTNVKEAAIVATSAWLIMNTETRRIERTNAFTMSKSATELANPVNSMDEECGKLHLPHEMTLHHSHTVSYSDVDFNLHANNAKYMDWIMDGATVEQLREYRIYEYQLNYIQEAHYSETVDIYCSTPHEAEGSSELELFYCGKRSGSPIFECRIVLRRA